MKKKLMAGAITLLSVATLAACSNSSEGTDLISMKGDVITEHQFFEEVKNNATAQQVLLNMTIQKVFEKQYGSEVSDKEVDDAVAEEQKKYGDSYQTILARSGMTAESRKAQIRTSKLVEYAVATFLFTSSYRLYTSSSDFLSSFSLSKKLSLHAVRQKSIPNKRNSLYIFFIFYRVY